MSAFIADEADASKVPLPADRYRQTFDRMPSVASRKRAQHFDPSLASGYLLRNPYQQPKKLRDEILQ